MLRRAHVARCAQVSVRVCVTYAHFLHVLKAKVL